MSRASVKLGYWSAVTSVILVIGYSIGAVLALAVFHMPPWTNLANYVTVLKPASLFAYSFVQATAFLAGPAFLILLCSLHEYALPDKKPFTKIAMCCMIATMVLGCQMYFVHFNVVRLIFSKANLSGLEQFVEWNPGSAIMASGVLGWTFFVGLAFLFVAPVFSGGWLERCLKYAFLFYGTSSIMGMLGHLFASTILVLIYFIGQTIVALVMCILASILFKRIDKGDSTKVLSPKSGVP